MTLLPLSWLIGLVAAALLLGLREAVRLSRFVDGQANGSSALDTRELGRHAPYLLVLLPLCVVAVSGDVALSWRPALQWHFPQLLLVYYVPLSRGILVSVLTFISILATSLSWRTRGRARGLLAMAAFGVAISVVAWQACRDGDILAVGPSRVRDGVIMQTSNATCVPASAVNTLKMLGMDATEAQMVALFRTTKAGTSAGQVVYGLQQIGVGTRVVEAPSIDVVTVPAILYVSPAAADPLESHAVAYMGKLADGRVIVCDPARGLRLWSPQDLARRWRGHAIEVFRDGVRPIPIHVKVWARGQ